MAKEVIQETLVKYLKDKEYSQIEAEVLSKSIANEVKNKLKGNTRGPVHKKLCLSYLYYFESCFFMLSFILN